MINREIIRIKIVQLTYAYYQNGNKNIDSAEKELFFSLSKAYDLYNYLLSLIVSITKEAGRRLEVAQARAKREGTPEPSQKFVFNRFALQLGENKALQEFLSTQKFAWEDSAVFLGQILETIESSETYKAYMASEEDSYEADRELWRKLYKTIITDNADLDAILEDQSLYWNDDKEIVDTFVLKTIKRFKEQNGAKEELLPEWDSEEEKDFARKLFRSAILNADQYQHYMSEASRNWDFSRLAYMDVILMQIAIAEMMTFPNVPISVSINEYVDIAKLYSTKKSGGYINGMLDAIARNLIKTGRLMKHMDPKETKATKEKKENSFHGEQVTIDGQPKKMRHRIKKGDGPKAEKDDKQ
ncbi:MAG: transcription antitermination factor NusB [Prevotella sp.]|nr:transcription antitermination factor NusB [Prevotella sp.]